ncbi:hypothetical protein V2J09_005786 [Rumex salicifolius]
MRGGGRLRMKQKKKPRHLPEINHTSMASRFTLPTSRSVRVSIVLSLVLIAYLVAVLSGSSRTWLLNSNIPDRPPQIYTVEVVNEFPHDPKAFTQGLLYGGNDTLFESTGLNGQSSVRKVELQTGKVEVLQRLDSSFFGEGLTLLGERLYQVAWLTNYGFIYDRNNLSKITKFTHQMTDGWGLATDGKILFGTDGTSMLYHIDPQTMKVIEKHTIKYKGHDVYNLNELEFVNGEVWANIWQTDCVVRISREYGSVLGWIILPELRMRLLRAGKRIDVLNGIAWDGDKNRLFVTGKLWPKLYEIKLHPLKEELGVDIEKLCITTPFQF